MKHHIVSIGISNFQNPEIRRLKYAAKDAIDFFTLLERNLGNIGYKKLLTDSEATLAQIKSALGSELRKEIKEDDVFFFLFSGHGAEDKTKNEDSLSHYLRPYDTTNDVASSCISVTELKEILDSIRCKASFVFLDTCFSGSINSKCQPTPRKKGFKTIKTFTNTVLGKGNVIFTASRDSEEAIEDDENQNGLFTFALLKELQKNRDVDKYPVSDISTPVAEAVIKRAKQKYNHTQTPTWKSYFEGGFYLPVFKYELCRVTPEIIEPPRYPELASASFPVPTIQLNNKKQEKMINELVSLVTGVNQPPGKMEEIIFERFCVKLLKNLKEKWEDIFKKCEGNVLNVPKAVTELESANFQFIALGSIVSIFGSQKQIQTYANYASKILGFTEGRAGLVALISVPEIILAEIIYAVGVTCIARKTLNPFKVFLNTLTFPSPYEPPKKLFQFRHIYYCDALGGYSNKVNDHIREVLKNYSWLQESAPELEGKIDDYQLQANLLLTMLIEHSPDTRSIWADFGRFNAGQVKPLISRMNYDKEFKKQVANFFDVKESEIRKLLRKYFSVIRSSWAGSGHWWHSIELQDFYTQEELEEIEKQKKQSKSQG